MNWNKTIKVVLFSLGLAGISAYQIQANSSGASSPKTGAPNENTCTSCHGGSPITSGTQHARIQLKANFTGNGYIPDSTYKITVTYAESGKSKFGFQLTALDAKNAAAGRFTASTRTGTFSSSVNGATRYYVEHNSTGSSGVATDSTAWTFDWRAPSSNVGDITFYLALNSTNNNGSSSGDVIYNKKFTVTPSSLLPEASASVTTSTICPSSPIAFEAIGTNNATSYSWTFPGGSPSTSSSKTPTVSYATAGNKIALLSVFNNKGASLTDTLNFTVLDGAIKPNLNIRTPNIVLCLGDTIEFSVGTSQKHTYKWRNGKTGKTNLIDTGGWVGVTAIRDNGCSINSDSVFVVAVPKPRFDVKYGLTTDSICTNESLIILLSNKGFSDSYSITSNKGPFFTDSFIIEKIKNGKNQFQYWAKSKIGCVSGPSPTKIFHGIDTPSAPNIIVKSRWNDRILFSWNSVDYAQDYEYSINNGTNWFPSTKDSGNQQWILLDSATQNVEFWVRAKTGNFCGFSKIGKVNAKGAGCSEPQWEVSVNQTTVCNDSTIIFQVSGINSNYYTLKLDNTALTDSVVFRKATQNKSWLFELFDASQPLCGSFEKSIEIKLDTAGGIKMSSIPSEGSLICGIEDATKIQLHIENFNPKQQYKGNWQEQQQLIDSQTTINIGIGSVVIVITGNTENNCPLESDTLVFYVDSIGDALFESEWIDNRVYRLTAALSDTINWEHTWIDSATGNILNTQNISVIDIDFDANLAGVSTIIHQIKSKRFTAEFLDTSCVETYTKQITTNNLSKKYIKQASPILFPNPIKTLKDLKCFDCSDKQQFNIYDVRGSLCYPKLTLDQIHKLKLSNGIYWIQFEGDTNSIVKIVVSE